MIANTVPLGFRAAPTLLGLAAALCLFPPAAPAAEAVTTGAIAGTISNASTGNLLEGAAVEVPQLGVKVLADRTGHFEVPNVPPGSYQIVASYSGLDPARAAVDVASGQHVTRDFDLSSGTYKLEAFKVAGEREGLAAALTAQRNSDYLKNVASMDQYGNLPNLNATELAMRLPGVTFADPGDEVVEQISVRGMGLGSSVITVDGTLMSSFSAQNRQTRMTAFNGAMFESLEVIKGHTPDTGADSLGGTVNFKTRSPLSMREKRRVNYTLSVSEAAPFTEQVPLRQEHRTHPLFNVAYQEKFRLFGRGEENLGVFVNAFYSENAFGFFRATRDFQQTNATPAYLWDYRTQDDYNNRMQRSLNTKFDYRLSPNSRLALNLIVNDAPEPMRRRYQTRAFAGSQTTNPSSSSGVVPGVFDSRITVVRALAPSSTATSSTTPAAAIDVLAELINRNQRLRHADLSGEHKLRFADVNWNATWSRTRYRTLGGEGTLTNRIGGIPFIGPNGLPGSPSNTIKGPNGETGVGWILDRNASDLYPRFTQNGGLDFTNPNNYRPTVNGLTSNAGDLEVHIVRDLKGDVRVPVPLSLEKLSLFFKTGVDWRQQESLKTQNRRRWSYLGKDALPTDPNIVLWDQVKTHRNIPQWEAAQFVHNGEPTDPSLWQEDRYFHEQTRYTGFNFVRETVSAAYVMTQGKFGDTGFLAGVRGERTDTEASAYVRNRVATTTAQQTADPVGAAATDYAKNLRERDGVYTKYFPSVHLYRNLTANLKVRLSWSTSFSRPSMANALPSETVSETAQTLTIGNPALLPQTAKNWDATVEYYYEPSGSVSAGWFHKTIKDYIVSNVNVGVVPEGPDNGYNGQYAGLTILTTENAGTAIAEGWEFSWVQQFRFLPGLLKGLAINANATLINAHGNFGTGGYLTNGDVINFIPHTGNVSLSWNYRRFGARILYNFTGKSIRTAYNFTAPSRNQYMFQRELWNLGLTYRLRPNLTLQLDVANLFNAPQRYYRGNPDQLQQFLMQGTTITAGVQGQF